MVISAGLGRAKTKTGVGVRIAAAIALALTVAFAVIITFGEAEAKKRRATRHVTSSPETATAEDTGASTAAKKRRGARHAYSPPQSAMVLDANTGKILYSANIDDQRYPASITKVMTLYLLFEQLKAKRISLETELKVSARAAGQAPSKLELKEGSTINVHDAMYALVTKSANDAAVTIAENMAGTESEFARFMNIKARALGMNNTTFENASGLPDPGQKTTARDLIILAQHMLKDFPEYAPIFRTRVFTYEGEQMKNHNGLLFTYPGCEGLKTGFTQASGFNLLASVRRGDKHLLAVVLGGPSARERNARMRNLLNQAWDDAVDVKTAKARNVVVASLAKPLELAKGPAPAPARDTAPSKETPQPLAARTSIAPEDLPERNPAFHATDAERMLAASLARSRELERQRASGQSSAAAAPPPPPHLVLATVVAKTETVAVGTSAPQPAAKAPEQNAASATQANAAPRPAVGLGPYHVQVGSYLNEASAKNQLQFIAAKTTPLLKGHGELTVTGPVDGKTYYRARFGRFSEEDAKTTCAKLKTMAIDCLVIRAE